MHEIKVFMRFVAAVAGSIGSVTVCLRVCVVHVDGLEQFATLFRMTFRRVYEADRRLMLTAFIKTVLIFLLKSLYSIFIFF